MVMSYGSTDKGSDLNLSRDESTDEVFALLDDRDEDNDEDISSFNYSTEEETKKKTNEKNWFLFLLLGIFAYAMDRSSKLWESSLGTEERFGYFSTKSRKDMLVDMDLISQELKKEMNGTRPKLKDPFPTQAFWTNFVVKDDTGSSSNYPVVVYPYAYKWSYAGLQLCYPASYRVVNDLKISDFFNEDFSFGFLEGVGSRKVTRYSELSVTLRFNSIHDTGYMETYLVQGSPYATLKYEDVTPVIRSLQAFNVSCVSKSALDNGLCMVQDNIVSGVLFLIQIETQNWILFASEPVIFSLKQNKMVSQYSYVGVMRLSLIPPNATVDGMVAKKLLHYAAVYPTNAKLDIKYGYTENILVAGSAYVTFQYDIEGNGSEILMLALKHHLRALDKVQILFDMDGNYTCIKGDMIWIVGKEYKMYDESLLHIPEEKAIGQDAILKILRNNLELDAKIILPTTKEIYGFGKEIFRIAQLALIMDEVGMDNSRMIRILFEYLSSWLNDNNLVYDEDLGGIVTLKGLQDPSADFGNGIYNDHHFHYGYLIYASAILSKYNSTFFLLYAPKIELLIGDVANPYSLRFPFVRHKAWYDGHSWASGLSPLADGKSQESSSEAINCYYAIYLWYSLQDEQKTQFPLLLLAMEIRSVKTYWHTGPNSTVYESPFRNNYMVGNLGMLDVTSTVWFGDKSYYVHFINMMPITHVTALLFDHSYTQGEFYDVLKPLYNQTEQSWKGYFICNQAIVEPAKAWRNALTLETYQLDTAITKSQVLYWIATRPIPFNATFPPNNPGSCQNNPRCSKFGLQGLCCPTSNGMFLGCCHMLHNNTTETSNQKGLCQNNLKCTQLGLKGLCCPTVRGYFLNCCH